MIPTPGPVLAADLGGTKITAGVVLGSGEVLAVRTVATGAMRGPDAILGDLHRQLRAAQAEALAAGAAEPVAVGMGTAGVVDPASGVITAATDAIPGWVGTAIGPRTQEELGLPTAVLNDVHAHGLGEAVAGAGADRDSMLLVAVGTGIGGAIVRGGQVVTGYRAAAAHVGHVPVPEADGVRCTCGRMGHLEGLASGPGTLEAYRRAGGQAADTRELVAQAEAGNALAVRVLDRCAHAVGRMIGAMLNVFDVEAVVLTGGMAGAGQLWWDGVREGAAAEAMDLMARAPILPAGAGANAALLGAAQFARQLEQPKGR